MKIFHNTVDHRYSHYVIGVVATADRGYWATMLVDSSNDVRVLYFLSFIYLALQSAAGCCKDTTACAHA